VTESEMIEKFKKLHREFERYGMKNPEIFALIELARIINPKIKEHEINDEVKRLRGIVFNINTTLH
jgi:hypothetical protein